MKPIRMLLIGHSYVLGVNRATAREVAKDSSFEITIAAPTFFHGDLRPIECELEPDASPLKLVPIPARWTGHIHVFQYSSRALRNLILTDRFDGIHVWEEPYIFAGYQIAQMAARATTPFCFRTAQSLNKYYPPPFNYFEQASLRAAKLWIAGGKTVFDNLVTRGYPKARGRIITLAVDTSLFLPTNDNVRDAVRSSLDLKHLVIGFVGRLTVAKGLRVLMQVLEGLDAALPWCLLLLGDGPMKAEIQGWAKRHGLENRVRIHLARHDEVPKFMAAMDILVAPSQTMPNWKEQFGRMLIEAFACGVPVIASDSGEIPNVAADAAVIVGEKDVLGWRRAITTLLKEDELRKKLRLAGMERATHFSATEVARDFRDFYRELVS
jgi:phosphatidyl-myo-inositol dimannoside synthase